MTAFHWLLVILVFHFIHGIGTWRYYELAGYKRWQAFVPVYNMAIFMKIINRPTWWIVLLYIPIINLLMIPVIWLELLQNFGKSERKDAWITVLTLGLYLAYLNYTNPGVHITDRSLIKRTATGDTLSSIVFAVIVATLVHTYAIQPFVIPTASLEKSLLIGDFLFVSKFHYGARTPMTPIAAPMVHDTIPLIKTKSYLSWPQLPYFRCPGFEDIHRNDIVVFNWPADTVYKFFDRSGRSVVKPIDKKSNYVKRCVGLPGDSLQILHGDIYINGKLNVLPERAKPQFFYTLVAKGDSCDPLLDEYDLRHETMFSFNIRKDLWEDPQVQKYFSENHFTLQEFARDSSNVAVCGQIDQETFNKLNMQLNEKAIGVNLTQEKYEKLKADSRVESVKRFEFPGGNSVFPQVAKLNWSVDNFGTIFIPKAGSTVPLNENTYPIYKKAIRVYEGQDLKHVGGQFYIGDKVVTSYTFQKNYYWMMGDNRHNSEDSRYWGFVPDDHIVGKPVFIWFSLDWNAAKWKDRIRWDRIFTTVSGDGQPQSYFQWFLLALVGYFVGSYFWNKRKNSKA